MTHIRNLNSAQTVKRLKARPIACMPHLAAAAAAAAQECLISFYRTDIKVNIYTLSLTMHDHPYVRILCLKRLYLVRTYCSLSLIHI